MCSVAAGRRRDVGIEQRVVGQRAHDRVTAVIGMQSAVGGADAGQSRRQGLLSGGQGRRRVRTTQGPGEGHEAVDLVAVAYPAVHAHADGFLRRRVPAGQDEAGEGRDVPTWMRSPCACATSASMRRLAMMSPALAPVGRPSTSMPRLMSLAPNNTMTSVTPGWSITSRSNRFNPDMPAIGMPGWSVVNSLLLSPALTTATPGWPGRLLAMAASCCGQGWASVVA